MKKRIVLALILAMIPMLCAYKVPAAAEKEVRVEVPVIPEEYLKYQELLDTLEAGNFDEARNMVEQMRPAPEYPPVTEVEITADNFLDYFEYVELPELGLVVERFSSGEPAAIFASSGFFLKDAYQVHPLHREDIDITADVKYTRWLLQPSTLAIDFDAVSYTLEEPLDPEAFYAMKEEKTLHSRYSESCLYLTLPTRTALLNDYVNYAPQIIDSVELVSASGTLYLAG